MTFFSIDSQVGLDESGDGIMGLCRPYYSSSYSSGPLYVEGLYNSSMIDAKIIAVYLDGTEGTSLVQFGTYSTVLMRDSTNLVWMTVPTNLFWINKVDGIRVGTTGKFANGGDSQYATPKADPVIFDTGTSLVYLPATIGPDIISKLLRGKRYTDYFGIYLTTCDTTKFDSLFIHIDGHWYEIPPSTYLVNFSSNPD